MPPRNTDPGPRSHMDRFLEWADQNLWGDPQPRAYDDMPVTDFSQAEMDQIMEYERQNPMSRQNRAVQGMGTVFGPAMRMMQGPTEYGPPMEMGRMQGPVREQSLAPNAFAQPMYGPEPGYGNDPESERMRAEAMIRQMRQARGRPFVPPNSGNALAEEPKR